MIRWSFAQKFFFILDYAWGKLSILWMAKSPRWALFTYEIRYSLTNFLNSLRHVQGKPSPVLYSGPSPLNLRTGIFEVRCPSHDAALVSPGFEAGDFRKLFFLIRSLEARGREIWFIDVGANIGAFSVRVGRKFPEVKIWSVEPAPENLRLLRQNLKLNGVHATILPVAASNTNGEGFLDFSGAQGGDTRLADSGTRVEMKRLDLLIPKPGARTTVILKIDIEGHEIAALNGLEQTLVGANETWVLVEDIFERQKLEDSLGDMGFHFRHKVTPYNSWWSRTL